MQILVNPGAEDGLTGWDTFGPVEASSSGSLSGAKCFAVRGITSGFFVPGRIEQALTLVPGRTYTPTLYVNPQAAVGRSLYCAVDKGDGVFVDLSPWTTTVFGYQLWQPGAFQAVGTAGWFRIYTAGSGGLWRLDDLYLDEVDVAILLAQRSIDGVVAMLKAELPALLAQMPTDFGVSVNCPVPTDANYFKRELRTGRTDGAAPTVEVYEGDYELEHPYEDIDCGRSTYVLPLTIRLTHVNTDAASMDVMTYRKRMYAAALVSALRANSRLVGTDDAIKVAIPTVVQAAIDRETEEGPIKVQVTIGATVQCEEVL